MLLLLMLPLLLLLLLLLMLLLLLLLLFGPPALERLLAPFCAPEMGPDLELICRNRPPNLKPIWGCCRKTICLTVPRFFYFNRLLALSKTAKSFGDALPFDFHAMSLVFRSDWKCLFECSLPVSELNTPPFMSSPKLRSILRKPVSHPTAALLGDRCCRALPQGGLALREYLLLAYALNEILHCSLRDIDTFFASLLIELVRALESPELLA